MELDGGLEMEQKELILHYRGIPEEEEEDIRENHNRDGRMVEFGRRYITTNN